MTRMAATAVRPRNRTSRSYEGAEPTGAAAAAPAIIRLPEPELPLSGSAPVVARRHRILIAVRRIDVGFIVVGDDEKAM